MLDMPFLLSSRARFDGVVDCRFEHLIGYGAKKGISFKHFHKLFLLESSFKLCLLLPIL